MHIDFHWVDVLVKLRGTLQLESEAHETRVLHWQHNWQPFTTRRLVSLFFPAVSLFVLVYVPRPFSQPRSVSICAGAEGRSFSTSCLCCIGGCRWGCRKVYNRRTGNKVTCGTWLRISVPVMRGSLTLPIYLWVPAVSGKQKHLQVFVNQFKKKSHLDSSLAFYILIQ